MNSKSHTHFAWSISDWDFNPNWIRHMKHKIGSSIGQINTTTKKCWYIHVSFELCMRKMFLLSSYELIYPNRWTFHFSSDFWYKYIKYSNRFSTRFMYIICSLARRIVISKPINHGDQEYEPKPEIIMMYEFC